MPTPRKSNRKRPRRCSAAVANAVPPANRVAAASPVASLKAVKNAAEKAGMRAAHARDGAAVCRAFSEASRRVRAGEPTTERDVDALLFQARSADPLFLEPSFPTIAGAGPNGAVIHGSPGDDLVTRETLLLVDSGGQYLDGTTDATRTMHFGTATAAERRAYTAVLKGHVAFDVAVFPEDTAGFVLDAFARKPLWALGYDYAHGTGHGVGAALNVHEGPISVSPRFSNQEVLKRGMVISNEPGYYEADAFGPARPRGTVDRRGRRDAFPRNILPAATRLHGRSSRRRRDSISAEYSRPRRLVCKDYTRPRPRRCRNPAATDRRRDPFPRRRRPHREPPVDRARFRS